MKSHLLAFVTAIALAGCGGAKPPTYKFLGNSTAPAAEGSVVVTTEPNGNTKLTIVARHLAPPERMAPDAKVYVVWVAPEGGQGIPQNVGALKLDANYAGHLTTVTPLRDFTLTIGVEADQAVQAPTNMPVVSTSIRRN